jgi:hypothetical protein
MVIVLHESISALTVYISRKTQTTIAFLTLSILPGVGEIVMLADTFDRDVWNELKRFAVAA